MHAILEKCKKLTQCKAIAITRTLKPFFQNSHELVATKNYIRNILQLL